MFGVKALESSPSLEDLPIDVKSNDIKVEQNYSILIWDKANTGFVDGNEINGVDVVEEKRIREQFILACNNGDAKACRNLGVLEEDYGNISIACEYYLRATECEVINFSSKVVKNLKSEGRVDDSNLEFLVVYGSEDIWGYYILALIEHEAGNKESTEAYLSYAREGGSHSAHFNFKSFTRQKEETTFAKQFRIIPYKTMLSLAIYLMERQEKDGIEKNITRELFFKEWCEGYNQTRNSLIQSKLKHEE